MANQSTDNGWHVWGTALKCLECYRRDRVAPIPLERRALDIGGAFHAVLEAHYQKKDAESSIKDYNHDIQMEAMRLYRAYVFEYSKEKITPWWTELAIERELAPGVLYSARYDLVGKWNGGLWSVEHKTAGSVTPGTGHSWDASGQILGQLALWRCVEDAPPLQGVLMNVISKEVTPRFLRHPVAHVPKRVLNRFVSNIVWAQEQVRTLTTARTLDKPWPMNYEACTDRYGRCVYFEECHN